jgi:hypothetical protein
MSVRRGLALALRCARSSAVLPPPPLLAQAAARSFAAAAPPRFLYHAAVYIMLERGDELLMARHGFASRCSMLSRQNPERGSLAAATRAR